MGSLLPHDGAPNAIFLLGIDHVQVAAPSGSEAQARWFYGDVLAMPEVDKPETLRDRGGVWFACGAHQLHVGIAKPFTPATKAHPALSVAAADLDRLAARLADAGCAVRRSRVRGGSSPPIRGVTGSSWSDEPVSAKGSLTRGTS